MAQISRQRLEFATAGFLSEARRQFVKMRPNDECPIKLLANYSPEQRSALMAAVQRAIMFSEPSHDKTFDAWMIKKSSAAK